MFKSQFVSVTTKKKVLTKGVIIKGVYCILSIYLYSGDFKCGLPHLKMEMYLPVPAGY
jgi:hypothetical protein